MSITIYDAGLADEFHIAHAGLPCEIWTRDGVTHYGPGEGQFRVPVIHIREDGCYRGFHGITTVNAGDFHTLATCPRARSDQSDNPPVTTVYPMLDAGYRDPDGYDALGYDSEGYNREGYDKDGYDRGGLDNDGYTRSQTQDSDDLDLAEEWSGFASRYYGNLKQTAFLDHLREIVRDPDAIDEIEFCGNCGAPAWNDDVSSAGNGTRLCDSCWEDWATCGCCEEKYPPDDLTETADGADICESCLEANYTWCDDCEGYYPDAEDHGHRSSDDGGCCESPQPDFRVRNDGCEPLANDTRFTITLPAGVISEEGLTAIRRYLMREGQYDLSYDLGKLGNQWQAKTGNYTRRLSRLAYQAHGSKLTPEVLSQVGCIARDHSSPVSTEIEVTRDLNQSAEDFANDGSCWWGSYSESRCAFKTNGGFGLRSFGEYDSVDGRAWVLPLKLAEDASGIQTGKLTPTFDTMTPDAFVVFNGYGDLSGYAGARIMAHMAGWTYCKIGFECSPMYVNSGGYLIAPEDIAEKYTDGSLRLSVSQHARLYENERELVNV